MSIQLITCYTKNPGVFLNGNGIQFVLLPLSQHRPLKKSTNNSQTQMIT